MFLPFGGVDCYTALVSAIRFIRHTGTWTTTIPGKGPRDTDRPSWRAPLSRFTPDVNHRRIRVQPEEYCLLGLVLTDLHSKTVWS